MVRLFRRDLCLIWDNQTLWPINSTNGTKKQGEECHLVAGLFPWEVYHFSNDPHVYICSYAVEILYLIVNYLHCSIQFVATLSKSPGAKVGNNWTGLFELIERKQIDFFLYPIYFSIEHLELIETNLKLPRTNVLSMLSKPKNSPNSDNPLTMFHCFDWKIWTLIVGSFLVYWLVNVVYSHYPPQHHSRSLGTTIPRTTIANNFLVLFAILVGQGNVSIRPLLQQYSRQMLLIWLLSSLLFRMLYSIDITAVLLSNGPVYIDRFEQLDEMGNDLQLMAQANKISHRIFLQKFPNLRSRLLELSFSEGTTTKTIQKLVNSNSVLLISQERAEDIQRYYHYLKLHVSSEGFNSSMRNFPIRKTLRSNYKKQLNRLFTWIHYADIYRFAVKPITFSNFDAYRDSHPKLGLNKLIEKCFPGGFPGVQSTPPPPITRYASWSKSSPIPIVADINVRVLVNFYLLSISMAILCLFVEIALFWWNRIV